MTKPKRRTRLPAPENGRVQLLPQQWDFSEDRHAHPAGRNLPFLKMTQGAYQKTIAELGSRSPEAAGILLGPKDDEPLATHFILDTEGSATSVSFTLGTEFLNSILDRYRQCDLACIGIAHSHPGGFDHPSHGDLEYLATLFGRPANQSTALFLFPIFSGGLMRPYLVRPSIPLPQVLPAALVLV